MRVSRRHLLPEKDCNILTLHGFAYSNYVNIVKHALMLKGILSLADVFLRYTLAIPQMVAPSQLDWDVMAAVEGLANWAALMADSDSSRKVDADQRDNTEDFMAYVSGVSR
jgi:hypothetical protein